MEKTETMYLPKMSCGLGLKIVIDDIQRITNQAEDFSFVFKISLEKFIQI